MFICHALFVVVGAGVVVVFGFVLVTKKATQILCLWGLFCLNRVEDLVFDESFSEK